MKQLNFRTLTFQKHLNDDYVTIIANCRIKELSMKKAHKLYRWLGRAFEEAERKKPHKFKIGDKVRFLSIVRRIGIDRCKTTRKYIYGTVVTKKDALAGTVPISNRKTNYENHDRRIYVKFDTKDQIYCPLCWAKCGSRGGMRCNPDELELVENKNKTALRE